MTRDKWRNNPHGPAYIVAVTNFVYRQPLPKLNSRAAMYRCLLQNLRLLPDPVVWGMVIPAMRKYCAAPVSRESVEEGVKAKFANGDGGGIAEVDAQGRTLDIAMEKEISAWDVSRKRSLDHAKDILSDVRAAVGVHPHAFLRLIRESYGIKSTRRHARLRSVIASSKPSAKTRIHEEALGPGRPHLPLCLEPLFDGRALLASAQAAQEELKDARMTGLASLSAKKARAQWQKELNDVNVPLFMPRGTGVKTGAEGAGIVETLHEFAKLNRAYEGLRDDVETDELGVDDRVTPAHTQFAFPRVDHLPAFQKLPPVIQKIFPIKLKPTRREPPFPKPPRHETKLNPKTWRHPVTLTPRLVSRLYTKVWDELAWTRPKGTDPQGPWVKCSYEEVLLWEQGKWDELEATARKARQGYTIASQARVSRPTGMENKWLTIKKQRKSTKSTIDQLLDPKKKQQRA